MIIFGFIAAVTVPAIMILWGIFLRKNPPGYLQGRLSFRTKQARSDEDLWNYSNALFSHIILITGINGGLASAAFYAASVILTEGRYWAAAAASLPAVQAVCVLLVYGAADFLIRKTYLTPEEKEMEEEWGAAEAKTLKDPSGTESNVSKE